MKSYVARQPIFNRKKELYSYELLFRGGMENVFPDIDGATATSQVLSTSFMGLDINELSNGKPIFVNFNEELLLKEIPFLFSNDKVVIEVLETVEPTREVIEKLEGFKENGYTIVLDDFEYSSRFDPILETASMVKLDLRALSKDDIKHNMDQLSRFNLTYLAEKVEEHAEFDYACEMGFEFFQGYFFSKPEVLSSDDISTSNMNLLMLLKEVYSDGYDLKRIEDVINIDVAIPYKLLRYLNSSYFGLKSEIESIRHAVGFLGIKETRRFISLLALSELGKGKPSELVYASVVRAIFGEEIAKTSRYDINPDEMFLLGLFSSIDSILGVSMDKIMDHLPISFAVKEALAYKRGPLMNCLNLVMKYERGYWSAAAVLARQVGITIADLPKCYRAAVLTVYAFAEL